MFDPQRVEIHGEPDEEGKQHWSLHWLADYHPGHPDGEHGIRERGQHFHTVIPEKYVHLIVKED